MKAIHITQTKDEAYALSFDGDFSIFELQTILLNALMNVQDALVSNSPEDSRQALKEVLYDKFNEQASALLEHIIPDAELRPDLDEQAILETQNRIIEERFEQCQQDN